MHPVEYLGFGNGGHSGHNGSLYTVPCIWEGETETLLAFGCSLEAINLPNTMKFETQRTIDRSICIALFRQREEASHNAS